LIEGFDLPKRFEFDENDLEMRELMEKML